MEKRTQERAKLDNQIRKTMGKMEKKGRKTEMQWRRMERRGMRGEAIINRILPEFLQETKGSGALATTSPGTSEPDISL